MFKKTLMMMFVVFSFSGVMVQFSYGKEFPTKPVEIYVGYTPGSTLDLTARIIADTAQKYLGQPLVVVNKPGAGGALAGMEVVKSKPDGYKIMNTTNLFFAMTTKTQKLSYNPNDLAPLATYLQNKSGLAVKGDSRWKTFNDVLEYARKNPGQLRWGHGGRGMHQHIYMLLIFRKAGVDTIDVPYKGSIDKLTALLGGHLDAAAEPCGAVKEHTKAGKIRYLVVISDQRYSDMPDVPCAAELGYPDVATKLASYFGLYAHKDTPEEIRKVLYDAFKKTCEDPEFRKRVQNLGEEVRYIGPEPTRELIKKTEEMIVPELKKLELYVEQ